MKFLKDWSNIKKWCQFQLAYLQLLHLFSFKNINSKLFENSVGYPNFRDRNAKNYLNFSGLDWWKSVGFRFSPRIYFIPFFLGISIRKKSDKSHKNPKFSVNSESIWFSDIKPPFESLLKIFILNYLFVFAPEESFASKSHCGVNVKLKLFDEYHRQVHFHCFFFHETKRNETKKKSVTKIPTTRITTLIHQHTENPPSLKCL